MRTTWLVLTVLCGATFGELMGQVSTGTLPISAFRTAYGAVDEMMPRGPRVMVDDPMVHPASTFGLTPGQVRARAEERRVILSSLAATLELPFVDFRGVIEALCLGGRPDCMRVDDPPTIVSLAVSERRDRSATVTIVWRHVEQRPGADGDGTLLLRGIEVLLRRDARGWVVSGFGARIAS